MAGKGANRAERVGADGRQARPEQRFRVRTVSVAFPVSNDGSRLVPPPNARSAPIAPARSRRGSHSYPARERARISNDINLLQKGLRLRHAAHTSAPHLDAGWSSPVARQAHNLKAAGSNPAPAPKSPPRTKPASAHQLRRASRFMAGVRGRAGRACRCARCRGPAGYRRDTRP